MPSLNSAWGIDIGNRALKAVRLVRGAEGIKVADVEVIEHEHILSQAGDNRDSLIQSALANFVQAHAGSRRAIAVGVSGQSSFARFIKLPPVETKKIPEIVRFEAIQQIPFPLDDVEWSYQLFQNEQSPDVEVGIFAMRRELVNRHIQYFTDSGLDVELVQMNPLAVYNAMHHDRRIKGTTMIVDLGAENTDLIIAEGETIWLRSIPIGGNNFTEALVKSFKLKFPKAEELKRNAATSKYGRQILQAMRPVFADLVAEIQRSIGFYASIHRESRINRVLALGGTFRLPGLQKYLQQNLQLDVSRLDRLGDTSGLDAKVAATFSDNLLSCVSAYGLALQAMGDAPINSSLLPQKIRRERMWRDKTKWFAAAAALFIAGTGVAYGSFYYRHLQDDKDHALNGQRIHDVLSRAQALDQKWSSIADAGGPDRSQIQMLEGLIAGRDAWNGLIRDIFATLPPGPTTPQEVLALAKIPRGDRKLITVHDFSSSYVPDLGPDLAMKDSDFALLAGTSNDLGRRPMPGVTGSSASPGLTGAASPPQRGYLITLHCTTPNALGGKYVTTTVVQALRDQGASSSSTTYRIARALVALSHKVTAGSPFIGQPRTPRTPRAVNGYVAPGAFGSPQLAPVPPPAMAGGPVVPPDPLQDPLIPAESMKDDTEVSVLVAVILDPAPPQAPGQAGAAPPGP
jgi:type IV pilus assembly protein PilM